MFNLLFLLQILNFDDVADNFIDDGSRDTTAVDPQFDPNGILEP